MNADGATDRIEEWCAALRTSEGGDQDSPARGRHSPDAIQARNCWVNGPEPGFRDAPAQNDVPTAVNDRQLGDRNRRSAQPTWPLFQFVSTLRDSRYPLPGNYQWTVPA